MKLLVSLLATALSLVSVQVVAQEVDLSPEMQSAVEDAQALGELLYRYDQAAWHGTDAFLEQFNERRDGEMMRGYVVVPREGNVLDAVFFGEIDGQLYEVARYGINGSRVVSRNYHRPNDRPVLAPEAEQMAAARQSVIENLRNEEDIRFCANAAANTITLPPREDGSTIVYLLTPPTSNDSYPLGGHFRFIVEADGEIREWRRFLNTCFDLRMASPNGGNEEPLMTFVTHLLDPQPTEIHFFVSRYFPLPLAVGTIDNNLAWFMADGRLQEVSTFGE